MYTNTSWKLVLWAAEFTKSTHWSRNSEHCCCHGLFGVANLRAKLWQDKVGGFPEHLLLCLYFLMWMFSIVPLRQHCWFEHLEPNFWLALKWSGGRTDDICRSLPIEWFSSFLHQKDVLSTSALLIWGMNHKDTIPLVVSIKEIRPSRWIFAAHRSTELPFCHYSFMLLLSLYLNTSRFFCQTL